MVEEIHIYSTSFAYVFYLYMKSNYISFVEHGFYLIFYFFKCVGKCERSKLNGGLMSI